MDYNIMLASLGVIFQIPSAIESICNLAKEKEPGDGERIEEFKKRIGAIYSLRINTSLWKEIHKAYQDLDCHLRVFREYLIKTKQGRLNLENLKKLWSADPFLKKYRDDINVKLEYLINLEESKIREKKESYEKLPPGEIKDHIFLILENSKCIFQVFANLNQKMMYIDKLLEDTVSYPKVHGLKDDFILLPINRRAFLS